MRRIEIVANRRVNDLLAGQYRSVFRGRGMEFDEVREYQPGDDVRAIDWNVTARTDKPHIKRFAEERELTVLFLVDVSASGAFGSTDRSKLDLVVEMAAMLMFSALKNNDRVGLLTFCDVVIDYLPPRKGKSHVLHLVRQLVTAKPVARQTNLAAAMEFLGRVEKRRAVVFLISDFLAPLAREALAVTSRRHDLVAVRVVDPREQSLPNMGFVLFQDAETGEVVEVDTGHPAVRRLFASQTTTHSDELSRELRKIDIDELVISTSGDYQASLRRFFRMRERRFRA